MAAVVLGVALDGSMPSHGLVVGFTLIATSPWYLRLVGVRLPDALRVAIAFTPVALLNLGAQWFGLEGEQGHSEITLMILVYLSGETVALCSPRLAVLVATGSAAVTFFSETDVHPGDVPIWTIAVMIAVGCGFFIRALIGAILELQAAQAELEAKAATEERNRIAARSTT